VKARPIEGFGLGTDIDFVYNVEWLSERVLAFEI